MALTIKSIPVLKIKEAKTFEAKAKKNAALKGTVDFSKQRNTASKIIAKSKIKSN